MPTKTAKLEYLRCNKLGFCQRCSLAEAGRTKIVFGSGNSDANMMIIGEGPGRFEDLLGEPLSGRPNQLLNKLLQHGGTSREAVYMTNIVKCRTPQDRGLSASEVAKCSPYLHAQISLVRPATIVTLGRVAGNIVQGNAPHLSMTQLQQSRGVYENPKTGLRIPVVSIPHPAYLLRQLRPVGGKIAGSSKAAYNKVVQQMKQAVSMSEPLEFDL